MTGERECGNEPSASIKKKTFSLSSRENVNFSYSNIFYRIVYIILSSPMRKFEELYNKLVKKKRQISPITGPRCQDGSRKLRFPDYVTMA